LPIRSLQREDAEELRERLVPKGLGKDVQDRIWIHAASLGESAIAQNLVEQISLQIPGVNFLITTNTHYARDLLKKKVGSNVAVRSLPLDLPFSINRLMRGSTFRGLILVETELWPNLIWKAHRQAIPIMIINGRISDSTIHRYKAVGSLLKRVFSCVDLVLAQSVSHADRFVFLGMDPSKVIASGNLKYFRTISPSPGKPWRDNVVTFGSIKERELESVANVVMGLKKQFPRLLVFIAPRELHLTTAIQEAFQDSLKTKRYSALKEYASRSWENLDVVVVDTVGDLLDIYGESQVAFVGGSLAPYGGQNMLEPLFFGTPVLFGPYIENFKEIAEQIKSAGGGIQVTDENHLLDRIAFLLNNEEIRSHMGKAGRSIIDAQNRVMVETVSKIEEVLWKRYSHNS
jgi:3-deoxy-D-manno-octulosonic-acid transferase